MKKKEKGKPLSSWEQQDYYYALFVSNIPSTHPLFSYSHTHTHTCTHTYTHNTHTHTHIHTHTHTHSGVLRQRERSVSEPEKANMLIKVDHLHHTIMMLRGVVSVQYL